MHIFFIILGLVILFLGIFYLFRRKWAIKKVRCRSDEEKLSYINAALEPFGFEFDLHQDIIISRNDAWQREMGYCDFYDEKAPFFHMVMDSLPIFFDYDSKHYRIEFWKGQYGITTGAEAGIYIHDLDSSLPKDFYRCARDFERLNISFMLSKQCHLFSRCDTTWWLTGFYVGLFSRPRELKMKICVQFPCQEMLDAFLKGLKCAGYADSHIEICENFTVCFPFCIPSNYYPNHTHKITKCIAQFFNYINCRIFLHFTRYFNRTIDRLTYLRFFFPGLYRFILCICVPRRKYKKYHKKIARKNKQ